MYSSLLISSVIQMICLIERSSKILFLDFFFIMLYALRCMAFFVVLYLKLADYLQIILTKPRKPIVRFYVFSSSKRYAGCRNTEKVLTQQSFEPISVEYLYNQMCLYAVSQKNQKSGKKSEIENQKWQKSVKPKILQFLQKSGIVKNQDIFKN